MSRMQFMTLSLCAGLVVCVGCSEVPLPNKPTPSPQSPNDKTSTWSESQVVDFMQGMDDALDNMFLFLPATTTAPPSMQNVNSTSACSGFFASEGNIVVGGTFSYGSAQNANAQDGNSFALKIALNNCQLDAGNGNNVNTYDSSLVTVEGAMTSVLDANGVMTNTFADNQISGMVTLTTAAGAIPCQMLLTNSVTYQWSNNLNITGNWSGTVCGVPQNGNLTQNLPVVAP